MCAQVTASARVKLLSGSRVSYGVLAATRSGAFAWLQPLSAPTHATLAALCAVMQTGVAHIAGLNPQRFRTPLPDSGQGPHAQGYGAPPPVQGVLDGELLWRFAELGRTAQARVAERAKCSVEQALAALAETGLAASFY